VVQAAEAEANPAAAVAEENNSISAY